MFSTRYGPPIEPRNFNRAFTARSTKASVREIRSHDTRHTCGSLLAALDLHPRIAMQILRHSKIAVTWRSTRTTRPRPHAKLCGSWASTSAGASDPVAVLRCCTTRESPYRITPIGALSCGGPVGI
ncbi:tyrosine-type recombinase/integrase [Streptomyces maoxianensis]|uniref:Tyrosine-type recombinase/integrase n=1 Tax=Streptomyces maoxianensis TaxID=1459942 RepID=A0ABV9G8U5_9ACTN